MKIMKSVLQWMVWALVLVSMQAVAQTGGTVTYVYTDPQGTPLAEADASGNITATFEYTPYGTYAPNGTSSPGPTPNGPGYTGHVNDPETNLVYMQARYYDPATGQFLSVDPIGPATSSSFDFPRYLYARDNPIMSVDPTGAFPGDASDAVDCAVYNCKISGADSQQIERAQAAMDEANAALTSAGVLGEPFEILTNLLYKWSDAVIPITKRMHVEIGSSIYQHGADYFSSPAYSTGNETTIKMDELNLNPEGHLVAEIHTHPIERNFSGWTGWADYLGRAHSSSDPNSRGDLVRYYSNRIDGYVALPSGAIYGWGYKAFQTGLDNNGGYKYLSTGVFLVRGGSGH